MEYNLDAFFLPVYSWPAAARPSRPTLGPLPLATTRVPEWTARPQRHKPHASCYTERHAALHPETSAVPAAGQTRHTPRPS